MTTTVVVCVMATYKQVHPDVEKKLVTEHFNAIWRVQNVQAKP